MASKPTKCVSFCCLSRKQANSPLAGFGREGDDRGQVPIHVDTANAHLRGASDRAIAHQTRHRSLATLGQYVRVAQAWDDNAATQLGL
jgi:hypothetical protein